MEEQIKVPSLDRTTAVFDAAIAIAFNIEDRAKRKHRRICG